MPFANLKFARVAWAGMLAGALALVAGSARGAIWINEFHYDDTLGDANEFVELVLGPGMDVNDVVLTLYEGGTGTGYRTLPGNIFSEGAKSGGFTIWSVFTVMIDDAVGVPAGLAVSLSSTGDLIQFLSYEGVFTATAGPADGVTSVDVGRSESSTSTNSLHSLQLTGSGAAYGDFSWIGPTAHSPGQFNAGQTIVPEATSLVVWATLGAGGLWVGGRRAVRTDGEPRQ